MNNDFSIGPFEFTAGRPVTLNGVSSCKWTMHYGSRELASHYIPEAGGREAVREAFADDRAAFVRSAKAAVTGTPCPEAPDLPPMYLQLVEERTGEVLGELTAQIPIEGLTPGLINDSSPTWFVTRQKPTRSMPMTRAEFAELHRENALAYRAKTSDASAPVHRHSWIESLLPIDVLSDDASVWRPPSAWEIRHVVGEGSFTGISGAKAAELVGVSAQNFRKYTAGDGSSTRQSISFAMWHLLLHKLGVQASRVAL